MGPFSFYLQEIFEEMDWDKNGYITPIEFKSYLAGLRKGEEIDNDEVYEAFEKIDKDGSKHIEWEEFLVRPQAHVAKYHHRFLFVFKIIFHFA